MRTATVLGVLLCMTAALASAPPPPCDPSDTDSLCLRPLRRSARNRPTDAANIPTTLSRARGARSAGAAASAAFGAARRRRRRSSSGGDPEGTDEAEDEEEGEEEEDDGFLDACFPASASVVVQGKGLVRMDHLQVGDAVLLSGHRFSNVFMFSHRLVRGSFPFVKLRTDRASLTISPGHYLYAGGRMVTAASIRVGDALDFEHGQVAVVRAVDNVVEEGLYNPHTLHGELLVNRFRVSVYTNSVHPTVAETLLVPVRAAFRAFGVDITAASFDAGVPRFLRQLPPRGSAVAEL